MNVWINISDIYMRAADCMLHINRCSESDPDDIVFEFKSKYCSKLCSPKNVRGTPRRKLHPKVTANVRK